MAVVATLVLALAATSALAQVASLVSLTSNPFNTWSVLESQLVQPNARSFYSATVVEGQDNIYVFGGAGIPFNSNSSGFAAASVLKEFWAYNWNTQVWVPISLFARLGSYLPHCLVFHSAVGYLDSIYVWGGLHETNGIPCDLPEKFVSSFTITNHLYIYNTTSDLWTLSALAPGVPTPRMMHSAARLGHYMILFGGLESICGNSTLDANCLNTVVHEMYAYDFVLQTWMLVNTTGPVPTPRFGVSSAVNGDTYYVFGGCKQIVGVLCTDYLQDLWAFHFVGASSAIGVWTPLPGVGPMQFLSSMAVVFPNTDQAMLVTVLGTSTYSYSLSTVNASWIEAPPSAISTGGFRGRYGFQAVWIPARSTVWYFAGVNFFNLPAIIWEWSPKSNTYMININQMPGMLEGIAGTALIAPEMNETLSGGATPKAYYFGGMQRNPQQLLNIVQHIYATPGSGVLLTAVDTGPLSPKARMYHSWTLLNNIKTANKTLALMFGGWSDDVLTAFTSNVNLQDLWNFNLNDHTWENITMTGVWPSARSMHSAFGLLDLDLGDEFALYIYGGVTHGCLAWGSGTTPGKINGETWKYRPSSNTWVNLTSSLTRSPPPLAGAQLIAPLGLVQYVVLYGGFLDINQTPYDGVWVLTQNGWKQATSSSPAIPFARGLHGGCPFNKQTIAFNGGMGAAYQTLNDTWLLEFTSPPYEYKWSQLKTNYAPYSASHSLVAASLVSLGLDIEVILFTLGGFQQGPTNVGVVTWAENDLSILIPSCNPGYYGLSVTDCQPCPLGFVNPLAGRSLCDPCPTGTTTTNVGMTSIQACSVCVTDHCNGHGSCSVLSISNPTPECSCDSMWSGSTCSLPWPAVVVAVLVGVMLLIMIAVCIRRKMMILRSSGELQQQLLESNQLELSEFRAASMVDLKDVDIKRKVDEGAFGDVYEATYREIRVAIKAIRANLSLMDESVAEQMEREIEFMRTLRHTNIVFFFGAGRFEDGNAFIVVEWAARGSLYRILHKSDIELPVERRLQLLQQTAAGMRFLHSRQCIHRDLKTGNILVSEAWTAKISDFGTAKLVKTMHSASLSDIKNELATPSSGSVTGRDDPLLTRGVGTLLWTAPEVLASGRYGLPIDVYSFGIVMWEVWTRELPFEHIETSWDIISAVQKGERPPPLSGADPLYSQLMTSCWDGEPNNRPPFDICVVTLERLVQNLAELASWYIF